MEVDSVNPIMAQVMEPELNVRIWLEVGHSCEPQEWRVWVRGVAGADISAFVRKVEFQLRPVNKFPYPERVFEEPPYLVRSGWFVPTEILISVFLKHTTEPERIHLRYCLPSGAGECKADSRCIFYDVKHPSEELQMAVTKSKSSPKNGCELVVLPDSGEVRPQRQTLKTSVKRHLEHKQVLLKKVFSRRGISKRKANLWPTQSNGPKQNGSKREMNEFVSPIDPKLWANMKLPPSSSILVKDELHLEKDELRLEKDELQHLAQMRAAQRLYLVSGRDLRLPPLSDPLFDLPAPLASFATNEPDYVLQ